MASESGKAHSPSPTGGILCVAGARPNFMKVGPVMAALAGAGVPVTLVHTGQHYDGAMQDPFFAQLGIPEPDFRLEVGSGSHAVQTGEVMRRFEPVLHQVEPEGVVVVGDVNSTLACALVAAKAGVPVMHVEAGLRSFDRRMPEEVNRILTDQLAELLFTTEPEAGENLAREGVPHERVHFVGNVMIDTLLHQRDQAAAPADTLRRYLGEDAAEAVSGPYAVLTAHRPANVDHPPTMRRLVGALAGISRRLPVIFPVHPRARKALAEPQVARILDEAPSLHCLPPLGYREMLGLVAGARMVLTDSGGLQEETTALGVPCLTLRDSTERPVTLRQGTNTLVGTEPARILSASEDILTTGGKAGRIPELWDGHAAERVAAIIQTWRQDRTDQPEREVGT